MRLNPSAINPLLVAGSYFRQWIVGDVSVAFFRVDFPQALIASGHQIDHLFGVLRVEFGKSERSFQFDWWNTSVTDALSEDRIAANVAFGRHVKFLGIQVPDDVAKIQIAVHDRHYIFAADFAAIPFITLGQTNFLD